MTDPIAHPYVHVQWRWRWAVAVLALLVAVAFGLCLWMLVHYSGVRSRDKAQISRNKQQISQLACQVEQLGGKPVAGAHCQPQRPPSPTPVPTRTVYITPSEPAPTRQPSAVRPSPSRTASPRPSRTPQPKPSPSPTCITVGPLHRSVCIK